MYISAYTHRLSYSISRQGGLYTSLAPRSKTKPDKTKRSKQPSVLAFCSATAWGIDRQVFSFVIRTDGKSFDPKRQCLFELVNFRMD